MRNGAQGMGKKRKMKVGLGNERIAMLQQQTLNC